MGNQTTYTLRLIDRVSRTAGRIAGSFGRINESAQRASKSINMMGVIAGGVAVGAIFKLGAELETTGVQFNTLLGSVEKGTKLFDEINQFANVTPFSNSGLLENSKLLLAMGVDSKDIVGTLKMLGSVAGTDEAKLSRMALQYGQVISKGKLQAQEFNSFAEAGINIYKELERVTGKSANTFRDMQAKGTLTAAMVKQAFEGATGAGGRFDGMVEKLSKTMAGKWSTVMGKGRFAVAKLGLAMKDVFVPILNAAITIIDKLSVWVDKNQKAIKKWARILLKVGGFILTVIVAVKAFAAAAAILNAVLNLNPILAIVTALVAVAFALDATAQKVGGWSNLFAAFGDLIDNVVSNIKSRFAIFSNLIEGMTREFSLFKSLISGDISFKDYGRNKLASKGLFDMKNAMIASNIAGTESKIKGILGRSDFSNYIKETQGAQKAAAGAGGGLGGAIGLSAEAKKLQAEGVVSGNIQSFNININTVNGINTLTTNNMEDGADSAGKGVLKAIMESIADVRPA